jgi:hypothetical protein
MLRYIKIKALLLLTVLIASSTNSIAQEKRASFSFSLGPSFPVGNFASKDYDNTKAGWALPGVAADLVFSHKVGNGNFSLSAMSRSQFHMMDGLAYVNELDANLPDAGWSIEVDGWSTGSLLLGGNGSFTIAKNATFEPRLMVGYMAARLPDYTVLGSVNGSRFWVKQVSTTAVSFSYLLGAGFKFDLGKKCMLLTQMDYLGGAPEFSQVEILTSSGNRSFDTWRQNTSTINLTVGIGVKI